MTSDCDELLKVSLDNLEFYSGGSEVKDGKKFCDILERIIGTVEKCKSVIEEIQTFATIYDFDESTPGNGYHSWIYVYTSAIRRTLAICRHVREKRESFLFRKAHNERELAAFNELLTNLFTIGRDLVENHKRSGGDCLFSEVGIYDNRIRKTMSSINLSSFYGRTLLFHFPDSIQMAARGMAVFTATFSHYYYSNDITLWKLLRMPHTFLKYFLDPDSLSERLVDIYENSQYGFPKTVTSLFELGVYGIYQELTEHKIDVNKVLKIPTDPIKLYSEKFDKLIDIPVPKSHVGIKPTISCRLLAARRRKGMVMTSKLKDESAEPSKHLIFSVHGGGWISQSSKLHGSYLREWTADLDVPILSVDYRLAPKAAFPRGLEEIFWVYCWALQNAELLGSTGENIVFVGDSAGGNLVTACTIKCIEMGIKVPKGILGIYSAFEVDHVVMPSRYLGLYDVILPYVQHMRLFNAYLGYVKKNKDEVVVTTNREIPKAPADEFHRKIPKNYLTSPRYAPDEILKEFPPTIILSTNLDSCLDECVEFAKQLKRLGVAVKLDVLEGLNHGFLNFSRVSKESHRGSRTCMQRLLQLLES